MSRSELSRFDLNDDGWCAEARHIRSPNFDARPAGSAIRLLVVHSISLPPGQFGGPFIADLFCNRLDGDAHPYFDHLRALRVSTHFLIPRDGALTQFVSVNERAWHAGVSSFAGCERCNDFSIGIELEGTDEVPFSGLQYDTLADLTQALRVRFQLTDVAGHEHIAPGRKTDPGPCFDWARYRQVLESREPGSVCSAALRFPPS